MELYYPILYKYVGANLNEIERHRDSEGYVIIQTVPGTKNMSGEDCVAGCLGTTNDWEARAFGEYPTIAEAREVAAHIGYTELLDDCSYYGHPNDSDNAIDYSDFGTDDDGEPLPLEIYTTRAAKSIPYLVEDWLYGNIDDIVSADSTDKDLKDAENSILSDAIDQGVYLFGDVYDYLKDYRDELKNEEECDDEGDE